MSSSEVQAARHRMVEDQLRRRGVRDPRVLAALGRVPRERFLPPALAGRAYEDRPLPIGFGQTISQPFVVARMCELAAIGPRDRVLEIGAGCGYQAAVLAELAARVCAVEIVPELAERARRALADLGVANVEVVCADGGFGWPARAPFDAVLVAAGAPQVPVLLLDQLADGGRLVLPVGPRDAQRLAVVTRHGDRYETTWDAAVRFVDLVGRHGFGGPGPARA